jgi:hypothetical protein
MTRLQKSSATYWADFAGYLNGGTTFYSSRDGSKLGIGTSTIWNSLNEDKFYKIELYRNATLSVPANDAAAGYLAFTIKLTWPAYLGETAASDAQQSTLLLPAAVTR